MAMLAPAERRETDSGHNRGNERHGPDEQVRLSQIVHPRAWEHPHHLQHHVWKLGDGHHANTANDDGHEDGLTNLFTLPARIGSALQRL